MYIRVQHVHTCVVDSANPSSVQHKICGVPSKGAVYTHVGLYVFTSIYIYIYIYALLLLQVKAQSNINHAEYLQKELTAALDEANKR